MFGEHRLPNQERRASARRGLLECEPRESRENRALFSN
jgi:hypothetical protein